MLEAQRRKATIYEVPHYKLGREPTHAERFRGVGDVTKTEKLDAAYMTYSAKIAGIQAKYEAAVAANLAAARAEVDAKHNAICDEFDDGCAIALDEYRAKLAAINAG